MKRLVLIIFLLCCAPLWTKTKTVEITGPLIAPWVDGTLCTRYWFEQKKVRQCFPIKAGASYVLQVPERVKHLKVHRTLDKTCKKKPNGKKLCRSVSGKFTLYQEPYITLDLTYDHRTITKNYAIPPKEAESYFGYPRKFPSIRFTPDYIGDTAIF